MYKANLVEVFNAVLQINLKAAVGLFSESMVQLMALLGPVPSCRL